MHDTSVPYWLLANNRGFYDVIDIGYLIVHAKFLHLDLPLHRDLC